MLEVEKIFPATNIVLDKTDDSKEVSTDDLNAAYRELEQIAVTLSDISKLQQRIFRTSEQPASTEQPQAGSEASPKPCLKCIHNQVCMIAAAALRNSGMDVVVNGCNYIEERTASTVR